MDESKIPSIGERAPEFAIADSTGVVRRLDDLVKDGLCVVVFYRGHWWPFCLRQLADYSAHLKDFRAAGAELVAISVDDAKRAESARKELGIKFPFLCDTKRETVNAYGLLNGGEKGGISFPASFVIDRDRIVRFRALEEMVSRVSVEQLVEHVRELGRGGDSQTKPRNRGVFPGLMFLRATMNAMRHGVRVPYR